jgi:FkbM family methyltransferase
MTEQTNITAGGRTLTMTGTVPLYLQWFTNWDADASALYASFKDLPEGSTVLDIGANIGMMACSLAAQRPDLKIIAVEPVPPNVECLQANVQANGLANVEVIHAAASDAPGKVHVNINGPWSAVLPQDQGGVVEVPAITVDSLISRQAAGIKIDVEGWEPYVLAGARDTLLAHRPLVFMEWNTWSLLAARHDPISFSIVVWKTFDVLEQFFQEIPKGAPTWDRQVVHDNVTAFGSVTDVLMRPKPGAILPSLEEMIYTPAHLQALAPVSISRSLIAWLNRRQLPTWSRSARRAPGQT